MNPDDMTLPKMMKGIVVERGDHPAIVTDSEQVSYAELNRRSSRMARALLAIGAGKGTRISLLAPDGIFWAATLLAATRIGALVSLVSTLVQPPELAHALRNSDCQILIGARRFLRHDYAARLTMALPGLERGMAGSFRVWAAPFLRSIWLDDADGLDWAESVDELLARADVPGAPGEPLLAAIEAEVVPSDEAIIAYTSGSTTFPKAVVHSQGTVTRKSRVLADYFLIEATDRMLALMPCFWVGGLTMTIMVLSKGATLIYPQTPGTEAALDAIVHHDANKVNIWGPQQARPTCSG